MVKIDERFEICALVFRLIPGRGYNETETDYQKLLAEKFAGFAAHPAVEYAKSLPLGYDAVAKFSVHIKKNSDGKFCIIDNLQALTDCGRWSEERYSTFIKLLNDFYSDTQFEAFFEAQAAFYEAEVQKFDKEQYGKINLEWFGKYMDVSRMRCVFSPSLQNANYAARVAGERIYCIVPHNSAIVHEYCHSFANPIAEKWYNENGDFKKLCDDTADMKKIPWYRAGLTYGYEYVTRAYNILYDCQTQQGEADLQALFARGRDAETKDGFPYIQQVYELVQLHHPA